MSADYARGLEAGRAEEATRRSARERVVLSLGPATAVGGVVWALAQPYRITLLHPHGQGFWWLVAEPPLYVVLVGLLFWRFVARGLVEDMKAGEER
jgi:hypothetical protein